MPSDIPKRKRKFDGPRTSVHRVTSPEAVDDEKEFDRSLRPKTFEEFVGHARLKDNLKVFIDRTW